MWKFLVLLLCITVVYAKKKTPCELHRQRELEHEALGRVIPECDENGDYKPLQCFKDSDFCQCWDKKGNHVARPSSKLKHCKCPLDRHESSEFDPTGEIVHVPTCTEDGKYEKKQCLGKSKELCWCVDEEDGEKITEPTKENVEC